jgi:hypothetical protein
MFFFTKDDRRGRRSAGRHDGRHVSGGKEQKARTPRREHGPCRARRGPEALREQPDQQGVVGELPRPGREEQAVERGEERREVEKRCETAEEDETEDPESSRAHRARECAPAPARDAPCDVCCEQGGGGAGRDPRRPRTSRRWLTALSSKAGAPSHVRGRGSYSWSATSALTPAESRTVSSTLSPALSGTPRACTAAEVNTGTVSVRTDRPRTNANHRAPAATVSAASDARPLTGRRPRPYRRARSRHGCRPRPSQPTVRRPRHR